MSSVPSTATYKHPQRHVALDRTATPLYLEVKIWISVSDGAQTTTDGLLKRSDLPWILRHLSMPVPGLGRRADLPRDRARLWPHFTMKMRLHERPPQCCALTSQHTRFLTGTSRTYSASLHLTAHLRTALFVRRLHREARGRAVLSTGG